MMAISLHNPIGGGRVVGGINTLPTTSLCVSLYVPTTAAATTTTHIVLNLKLNLRKVCRHLTQVAKI